MSIVRDYIHYQITAHGLQFPLQLFKIKQERSNSHLPVTLEQFQRMIAVLPENEPISLQRKLMLSMLWDTGMRGGEMLRLRIRDLDIKNRTVIINNEKNHRNRMIVWSPFTRRLLRKYMPLRKHLVLSDKEKKDDYLFLSLKRKQKNSKLTTRQLERIVEETKKAARIRAWIKPHSFRHGFVHRQLDEGKTITTVAQMLGHSTSMNVWNYAQLTSPEIRKAWGI